MYDWSKGIIEKIVNANCLTHKEICMVEIALRLSEIHEELLNETLGISKENKYELTYTNLLEVTKGGDNYVSSENT